VTSPLSKNGRIKAYFCSNGVRIGQTVEFIPGEVFQRQLVATGGMSQRPADRVAQREAAVVTNPVTEE